jgi:hypothetical protein
MLLPLLLLVPTTTMMKTMMIMKMKMIMTKMILFAWSGGQLQIKNVIQIFELIQCIKEKTVGLSLYNSLDCWLEDHHDTVEFMKSQFEQHFNE